MVLILLSEYNSYRSNRWEIDNQIPLTAVQVKGEIVDFVGHVTTSQEFTNKYPDSIEAIYMFNLSADSTVIGMKMKIGDRSFVSHISEKKEAREIYEKGVKEKKTSCLLEKASNGVYSVNVGQIMPEELVKIEIDYITQLVCSDNGDIKFVLPTNISPKYDAAQKTLKDQEASTSTTNALTFTSNKAAMYSFHVVLLWTSNNGIQEVKSLTNEISVTAVGEDGKTVRIESETAPSRGDFNVFVTSEPHPSVSVFEQGDQSFLMINHRVPDELTEIEGGDFTILVDRSGSMGSDFGGWSGSVTDSNPSSIKKTKMDYAREATRLFVQSLPGGSRFNVMSFGSDHSSLFPEPVNYTNETKAQALKQIESFRADMGGTELYRCLSELLNQRKVETIDLSKRKWTPFNLLSKAPASTPDSSSEKERIVILMTDGDIGNVDAVVELVAAHRSSCRVFTIGIGNDVNRFLCERIAAASHASCEILLDNTSISTVVAKMLDAATKSYYEQSSLRFRDGSILAVQKPLYCNQFLSVFHKIATKQLFGDSDSDIATIELCSVDGLTKKPLSWILSVQRGRGGGEDSSLHRFLPQFYAADLIRQLESEEQPDSAKVTQIVQLSCDYQVMNDRTSFVVIDERVQENAADLPVSVSVPQFSPAFAAPPVRLMSFARGSVGTAMAAPPPVPAPSGNFKMCEVLSADVMNEVELNEEEDEGIDSLVFAAPMKKGKKKEASTLSTSKTAFGVGEESLLDRLLSFQSVDGSFSLQEQTRAISGASSSTITRFADAHCLSEEICFNLLVLLMLRKDEESSKYVMIIRKLEKWLDKTLSSPKERREELLREIGKDYSNWFLLGK